MCGIVGSVNAKWVEDPLKSILQRGPDYSSSYSNGNLYLGHTRLSIIDTSAAGNQPMISEDEKFVVIFNGEIYNHLDIRDYLKSKYNVEFNSGSDTETLLKGWIHEGREILKRLNGIFAFAIYDLKKSCLNVVRDPYGVKPLYVYQDKDQFVFSSELKSFNSLKFFDNRINLDAVGNYLSFLWSPGEDTMYQSVKKVLPGFELEINLKDNSVKSQKGEFYSPNEILSKLTEEEWIDKVDEVLNRAVKRQMLSDVPLGFFLSGGLDSSLLVAMARKQNPNLDLDCFTINTSTNKGKEGFSDDLPYARKVAQHLGVNLHEVDIDGGSVDRFDQMIYTLDEPQADLAPENVRLICNLAKKKGIKVLIGGAAGDDLFSGYRRHHAILLEEKIEKVPKGLLYLFKGIINMLPGKIPFFRRMNKLSRDWGKTSHERLLGYFNWLPNNNFVHEIVPELSDDYNPNNYGEQILANNKGESLLQQMLYLEQATFLVDHNLNYTDKMSMLEGVEARVPFLDFELVALANMIPDSFKIKGGEAKYILKKVAERYLPKEVIYRSKTGFGAPVRDMISNELKPLIETYLSSDSLAQQGIFSPLAVQRLLDDHNSGKEDHGYTILSLLALQSWLKQFSWKK